MKILFYLLISIISFNHALPIIDSTTIILSDAMTTSRTKASTLSMPTSSATKKAEEGEGLPTEGFVIDDENNNDHESQPQETTEDEGFPVQIDRLAQIIATHVQFDHLDAVITNTDKEIATEFRHHIQISVESDEEQNNDVFVDNDQQHPFNSLPTLDMMDLEILKSQIFAAIQAHTEGNLPLTWDKLAYKLSKQAIESYLKQSISEVCLKDDSNEDGIVLSSCLQQHANELVTNLDQYISTSLSVIFEKLDHESLPILLKHTADDLKGILAYFNSVFLQDGKKKFVLEVIPWNSDDTIIHEFKSRLLNMAIHPSDEQEDCHSIAFFTQFAEMARV
ncbi:hypothetical protein BDF20DRAFT_860784 [Mycotypha africana]|uniref:uncharacterized protein n=1 Tax=Mycotypha africana TaxID=64632 RepID=UPI0022FFEFF3|nr:uncharacterized protein BDF20DRAFT_860784 [Mycotypha africana]KAI8984595.1 hypothetical protein BDF20DRAFT_860784 [Mycotypha africana]